MFYINLNSLKNIYTSAISIISFNRYGHVERFGMLNPKFSIISQSTNMCTIFYLCHINIRHQVSINDLNCGHELNRVYEHKKRLPNTSSRRYYLAVSVSSTTSCRVRFIVSQLLFDS